MVQRSAPWPAFKTLLLICSKESGNISQNQQSDLMRVQMANESTVPKHTDLIPLFRRGPNPDVLLLLLLLLVPAALAAPSCPARWARSAELGRCFIASEQSLNWEEARKVEKYNCMFRSSVKKK